MTVKDKQTYGEYYWSSQVEAATLLAEQSEAEIAAVASGLIGTLGISEILPDEFASLFSQIEAPSAAFLGDIGGRFVSEVADGAVNRAANPLFESLGYKAYMRSPTKKIPPTSAAVLRSRQQITDELFLERFRMGGFEPLEAEMQYKSMLAYPSIPDLMLYARYHGDPDNVRGLVWEHFDVPAEQFDLWEWQTAQRLTTEQAQSLFKRGLYTEGDLIQELAQIGWSEFSRPMVRDLAYLIPNAMLLVQGGLVQELQTEQLIENISIADIHPDYAKTYLDAILTKPATLDLVAYELRQDPNLSDLDRQLTKIGIHPDYLDVYKTLAYPIPPIADLVTMAVREAFTPAIAERFGQYEDFPAAFEEWAGKKGVSSEWAKRYWASHWSLPSATQGFSMLHRGIINETELNMLLRALDVMPFWRDKLVKVAYRPLTRVDVRRMYKEGILDEAGVYEAYQDHGYNEKNAKAMTDFTVQYVLTQQTKFTTRDVVSAYAKRMITASVARGLLTELGVRSENISFVISTADYKRQWQFTDERIKGIRNMYRRKVYDDNKAKSELLRLNIATDQVEVLMQQWWFEVKEEPTQNWTTAQTLLFMTRGLITESRGRTELTQLGYDDEHIEVYLRNLQWIPPKK